MQKHKLHSLKFLLFFFFAGILTFASCSPSSGPAPAAVSGWEGHLVRRPGGTPEDGKVYLVKDGKKHWVVSADWLKEHGYNFPGDVTVISAQELAQIPDGSVIQ